MNLNEFIEQSDFILIKTNFTSGYQLRKSKLWYSPSLKSFVGFVAAGDRNGFYEHTWKGFEDFTLLNYEEARRWLRTYHTTSYTKKLELAHKRPELFVAVELEKRRKMQELKNK